jgi:hypothetical protein
VIAGLAWHPYLEPAQVEFDLGEPLVRDRVGHRLHLAFALLWCFSLGLPNSALEIAAIPLVVFSVIRTPNIWRTWGSLVVQPVFLGILAFAMWQIVSLAWSPDRDQGWKEIAANRWVGVLWALWPVMMHRGLLIGAVAAGFACGNLAQLGQAVAGAQAWFPWHRMPGRISGWWDPVVGGSMLCGVLGMHLAAAVFGRGRAQVLGVAGSLGTGVGVVATGSRGAWVAAFALVTLALLVGGARGFARRGAEGAEWGRKGLAVGFLGVAALSLVVLALFRGALGERIAQAREEIAAAVEEHRYHSDTGGRVLMAYWGGREFLAHPVVGVGAGGFHVWAMRQMREEGDLDPDPPIHAHAHDAALHIAATTGIVGMVLSGLVAVFGLWGAWSGGTRASGGPHARGTLAGAYETGPLFGLVGLLLAGLTDPVHLNAQTGALLAALLAMSLVSRPAERGVP